MTLLSRPHASIVGWNQGQRNQRAYSAKIK